jgi:hypothetical protein
MALAAKIAILVLVTLLSTFAVYSAVTHALDLTALTVLLASAIGICGVVIEIALRSHPDDLAGP